MREVDDLKEVDNDMDGPEKMKYKKHDGDSESCPRGVSGQI